jgi:hypothetical protein
MKKAFLIITIVMMTAIGYSQDFPGKGKLGLGIDGINTSPNFLLKYFLSDKVAGQVIVGTDMDFPGGDDVAGKTKVNGTTFRGGLSVVYHFTKTRISPYLGVEGIYQYKKESGYYDIGYEPDAKSSLTTGIIFGGEFFIDKKFSLGIKESINTEIGFKRDIPVENSDFKIGTNTVLTARYYF